MIDLNKEAEEYAKTFIYDDGTTEVDFIAGANSKHVQAKILQAQIDILEELKSVEESANTQSYRIIMSDLKKQLKQLKDAKN